MRVCPDCRGSKTTKEVADFKLRSIDIMGVKDDGKLHAEVSGSGECREKPCPRCKGRGKVRALKIRFIFVLYDFWVGFYYNKDKKRLYFFPIPTLGCYIERG